MKKLLTVFLLLAMSLSVFVSCASGASVSIGMIRAKNELVTMFLSDVEMNSFTETIVYAEDDFTYEIYYERAQNIYAAYNICETVGDYRLYAYEGSVYTEDENGICAVLLLNGNYSHFVSNYLEGEFPLDGNSLNQKNSKKGEDGAMIVQYASTLTPQTAATLSAFGITGKETVLSTYTIKDDFVSSISYSLEDQNGTREFASRSFEKSSEKEERFASVAELAPSVSVDIIFVGQENSGRHFEVPTGVYVGVYPGENKWEFFRDEACTVPYSYGEEKITEDLAIYVK